VKTLQIETPTYDRIRKVFSIIYGTVLAIISVYLFLILSSSGEFISLKTLTIILITLIVGTVIPYSTYRILDNAIHHDKNNSLLEYAQQLEAKYNVAFDKPQRVYINQATVFQNKETGKRFWGVATVDDDGKTPLLKTIEEYNQHSE